MQLFLHTENEEVDVVEADSQVLVAAFVDEHGANGEVELWLEDADAPLTRERTLGDSGVSHHAHLHLGRREQVKTFVSFNSETKEDEFGPNSTFKRVFNWATGKDGFNLTAEQKTKHTLELSGTDTEPDMTAHIGSYAKDDELHLKLVPKDRHAG